MTTVINNPGDGSGEGAGAGVVLGVLIAIIIIVLFFVYGLPALRNQVPKDDNSIDVNVTLPADNNNNPAPANY